MAELAARVGANAKPGANRAPDVLAVQTMLLRHARWLSPAAAPARNGVANPETIAAITAFQRNAMALAEPDGAVDPGGLTLRFLNKAHIPGPLHRVFLPVCWARPAGRLTLADYTAAATVLECEVAAIQAVAEVETRSSPWDGEGRPLILFERHYFRRLTAEVYSASHPDLSGPQGGYGAASRQYEKLRRAAMLDERAALQSASWGAFQIMGANHAACGHANVEAFVDAMLETERRHLDAFVQLVRANAAWLAALQAKDWAAFARGYNGPNYADNAYDTRMAAAYARLAAPTSPAAPGPRAAVPPPPRPAAPGR